MESTRDYEIILNGCDSYVLNQFILKYKRRSDYREMNIYNIFLEQLKHGLGVEGDEELEKLRESIEFNMGEMDKKRGRNIDIKFDYNYLVLHLLTDFRNNECVVTIKMRLDGDSEDLTRESDKKMFTEVANNIQLELFALISQINNNV
jgi:hypothetical protein